MEGMTETNKEINTGFDTESPHLKTFFKTKHDLGNAYFSNSRVGSCSFVLVKNGQCLAVPFAITNRRGRSLNHFKTVPAKLSTNKSTYMNDYLPIGNIHCGMSNKPLVPYSPECYRSRLPINGIISGAAINRASIELGDSHLINRKQWKTTYRDSFRTPAIIPVSNGGIASDMAKASHMRLNAA